MGLPVDLQATALAALRDEALAQGWTLGELPETGGQSWRVICNPQTR